MRQRFVWQRLEMLLSIGIFFSAAGVLAQQGSPIGEAVALHGQATVQHAGASQANPLRVQSPLYQEDIIRTAPAAKLHLRLMDGTALQLGESGVLILSRFVYRPQEHTQQTVLTVVQGIFRTVTQTLLPSARFEVHTTTAVAAIRGTDWIGDVQPDSTGLLALRGQVVVHNRDSQIKGEVVLTPGLGTDVQRQQAPAAPKVWPEARRQAVLQATTVP
jgi:hypothetical protein